MQRLCSVMAAVAMTAFLCSAPADAQASTTPTQTAASIEQKCSADWAACSAQERLQIAKSICSDDWKDSWRASDVTNYGYDKLSRRDFYKKVGVDCTLEDKKKAAEPVAVAGNTYVKADVSIGTASRDGRRLTPQQRQQLNQLRDIESEELMGPRPATSRGYRPTAAGRSPIHSDCRGGRVVEKERVRGGYYARVDGCL